MDLRRGLPQDYNRGKSRNSRSDFGQPPPSSSSGRAIPPTAMPSLSTGQGFYTVESLQGATVVPPPQPAPPPPRLLPPPEPYSVDLPPPRHSYGHRFHPDERNFGPAHFDRRYPAPPALGRKMMMMPLPDLPLPRRGDGPRGHGIVHPPSPYFADPRMPGFHPGRRPPPLRGGWGPSRDFDRNWPDRRTDRGHDRSRPSQRFRLKKQGQKIAKPVSQAKSPSKSAAADEKSTAEKQNSVEGGPGWCAVCQIDCSRADTLKKHVAGKRHARQLETQMQVEKLNDKAEETSNPMITVANEAAEKTVEGEVSEVVEKTVGEGGEPIEKIAENIVIEGAKKEDISERAESAVTPKPVAPVAGKKRVAKEETCLNKKPRNSAASSDVSHAITVTAVKENKDKKAENTSETLEVCELCNVTCTDKAMLEAHLKGKKHAAHLKNTATSLKAKGEENKPPELGESLSPEKDEEDPKGVKDELKEVKDVADLANGKAGQSAEVQ